jgi:hypothetical protein
MSVVCGLRFLLVALVLLILAIASNPKLFQIAAIRHWAIPVAGSDPVTERKGEPWRTVRCQLFLWDCFVPGLLCRSN